MKTPVAKEGEIEVSTASDLPPPAPADGGKYERAVRHEDGLEGLGERRESYRFEEALRVWRESRNPIQAFEALAAWNPARPLPDDLASFLKTSSVQFVASVAPFVAFAGKNWSAAAGAGAFLDAFGFLGSQKKGDNPFLQLRRASLDYKAASSYAENCLANPQIKADEIVATMAQRAGVGKSTMWKHVKDGMKAMGITWSKGDVRTATRLAKPEGE